MKRKDFLNLISLGALGVLLPINAFGSFRKYLFENDHWFDVKHTFDDYNAEIRSNSIKEEIRIVHISDSHLSILENGKSECPEYTTRMDRAYINPKNYLTGEPGTKQQHFENILDEAKLKNADLIILTGDIINNPTFANVNYVKEKLDSCGIEYHFISGNHDWHFEGMPGSLDELHAEWITKRLKPLSRGCNPFYNSKIIKGINFVFIDNSTYQVEIEQLSFFREQVSKGLPIILCMHIPVYQQSDLEREIVETMGDPRWGAEYDEYYKNEKRERWPESGNKGTTCQFLTEILECKNLLAILAGHDHSAKAAKINPSAYQYLTKASYSGAYRYVHLMPAS